MLRKTTIVLGLLAGCFAHPGAAAYLDFTHATTVSALNPVTGGFEGSIDGIAFTLTSSDGVVNFNEAYDGSAANPGCQANGGPLACDIDGAGIGNDEVTGLAVDSGQVLTLRFATEVLISGFDFLDLYLNPDPAKGGEQARVSIDGNTPYLVDAAENAGQGGYASLDLLALGGPVQGQTIRFTAYLGDLLQDDRDNDYAFAGVNVSAVPLPAGLWLFGTALVGMLGVCKRRRASLQGW